MEKEFLAIISLIQHARNNAYRAFNSELINLYWNVGKFIHTKLEGAAWGEKTVDQLARYIQNSHPDIKGFNRRGLYRMRQFYQTYAGQDFVSSSMTQLQTKENQSNKIVSSEMTQLMKTFSDQGITFELDDIQHTILSKVSWTHHLTLISRTKSNEELEFYLLLSIKENYKIKELERQINSSVFERMMLGNLQLSDSAKSIHQNIGNTLRDNYVFEFLGLPDLHTEKDLQKGLIQQMKSFILELGRDFLFVGEEYKVQVGNSDFYIDLLFYHRGLQCLVAFELKADRFKPEQLGQLNFYLEALDRDVRNENENPSIGVLLCKDKDVEVVEYALSRSLSPTMVSEYKTQLPDKSLLQQKLHELFEDAD